jgi:hypothetical protein
MASVPMGHLRCQDGMGNMMKMFIKFTQLECGIMAPVFELNYEEYMTTILTHNWVTEIWAYLGLCKGILKISGIWTPIKQCEGDQALIEIAVKSGKFSASKIKEMNWCRIFLQAFFVSDITEVNGKNLSRGARTSKQCKDRNSTWE